MAISTYNNPALRKELLSVLKTSLNLRGMITIDTTLEGREGTTVRVLKYKSNGNAEKLTVGQGNTSTIGSAFTSVDYPIVCYQARTKWFSEEEMEDVAAVTEAIQGVGEALTNTVNADILNAINLTDHRTYASSFDFDAVVDAVTELPAEVDSGLMMLVNKKTYGAFAKSLKDQLKYIEAFVRTGYVGTVNGVSVYVCKEVPDNKAYIFSNEAVTLFMKENYTAAREREENTRTNWLYGRFFGFVGLTDGDKAVVLTKGTDPRTGYTVLATQPVDWAANYTSYYTYDAQNDAMVAVTGAAAPDFVAGKFYSKN